MPMSLTAGQFITETFDYDGGRQVTVYVPSASTAFIVFSVECGVHITLLAEPLEAANAPSTMIVGVHGLADDEGRLRDYVPTIDAERFAAHEKFFVEDVRQWVRSRFAAELPAE